MIIKSYWVIFEAIISEPRVSWILFGLVLPWVGLSVAVWLIVAVATVVVEVSSAKKIMNL